MLVTHSDAKTASEFLQGGLHSGINWAVAATQAKDKASERIHGLNF